MTKTVYGDESLKGYKDVLKKIVDGEMNPDAIMFIAKTDNTVNLFTGGNDVVLVNLFIKLAHHLTEELELYKKRKGLDSADQAEIDALLKAIKNPMDYGFIAREEDFFNSDILDELKPDKNKNKNIINLPGNKNKPSNDDSNSDMTAEKFFAELARRLKEDDSDDKH